jgi:hypothetical protein
MSDDPRKDFLAPVGEEGAILYGGVHNGHPGFAEALVGTARQRGGHEDPTLHNSWDTKSKFTPDGGEQLVHLRRAGRPRGLPGRGPGMGRVEPVSGRPVVDTQ